MWKSPSNNSFERCQSLTQIINYYEHYNIAHIAKERYEQKLYEAETLIEAFEVLKDMFETLMLHIVESKALNTDKFDLGDLEDEKQDESKNFEETVKKYQSEIRALSRVNDEIKKYAAETADKLELAMRKISKEEELTRVVHTKKVSHYPAQLAREEKQRPLKPHRRPAQDDKDELIIQKVFFTQRKRIRRFAQTYQDETSARFRSAEPAPIRDAQVSQTLGQLC